MTCITTCFPDALATEYRSEFGLRGSWYEIDLQAVRHNYRQLRSVLPPNVQIYACLKRNGYGCGAAAIAAALAQEGVNGFAVASLSDALAIRRRSLPHPILLYPGPPFAAGPVIERHGMTVSVSSPAELDQWRRTMTQVKAFVKVDLGFFRAGVSPSNALALLKSAQACDNVRIDGLYAHLSELATSAPTAESDQFHRMLAVLADAEHHGLRPPIAMMSSSDGVLSHPEMDLDAVDPGALLFGVQNPAQAARRLALRPALKAIVTNLVAVKDVDPSLGPLPNGPGFHAGMRLGVVGFGWGDGFPRSVPEGAEALVRGRRVSILPPAHLEHLRLDLTDLPQVSVGEPVILLGQQGGQEITLQELATRWNTDAIGLYARLRDHIPHIYL